MPHITTFDGLIAGPDKIANQLDGSQIEQAELMEHAPKDSEYRPDNLVDVITGKPDSNWVTEKAELMELAPKEHEYEGEGHGDINNPDNPVGSTVTTCIFAPSAEMYSFGECESLDFSLEQMLDQLNSDSILAQSDNQLLSS